jgi:hypothetical protein
MRQPRHHESADGNPDRSEKRISFKEWQAKRLEEGEASTCQIEVLAEFRLDGDYAARSQVRRVRRVVLMQSRELTKVWFHIRTGDYNAWIAVAEDTFGRLWLVSESMRGPMSEHLGYAYVCAIMTAQGVPGLWVNPLHWSGKGISTWNESVVEIAQLNVGACIRLRSVQGRNIYEHDVAPPGQPPAPEWPDSTMAELVASAFGLRVIRTPDDMAEFGRQVRGHH